MGFFDPFGSSGGSGGGTGAPGKDGRGISTIDFLSSSIGSVPGIQGAVDIYQIIYTDGTRSTYVVKNGEKGEAGAKGETGADDVTLKARLDDSEIEFGTRISRIEDSLLNEEISINLGLTVSGTRLQSQKLPLNSFPLTVRCDSLSYSFYVAYYKDDGTQISNTDWRQTEQTYTTYPANTGFAKVICKANDEHTLSKAEVYHFSASTTFDAIVNLQSTIATVQSDVTTISRLVGLCWEKGFIQNTGIVNRENVSDRRFSNEIPCSPGTVVSYIGETDHAGVSALTFYGAGNSVLQTNSNIGDSSGVYEATAPVGTMYLRISKKTTQQDYLASSLPFVTEQVNKNTKDIISATEASTKAIARADTITKVLNYGPQTERLRCSFKKGYVHEVYYNNPKDSTYTAFSNLFETVGDVKIKVAAGYKALVVFVDSKFLGGSWTQFTTSEFTVSPSTPYYCIEFRKTDNSVFNLPDVPENVVEASALIGTQLSGGSVCYVQSTGDDNNDGKTRSTPFATIQKAVNEGFANIFVREGTYADGFTLLGKRDVSIMLDHFYDTFNAGTDEDNPKIVIDGSLKNLSTGCTIQDCSGCVIKNIEIKKVSNRAFVIDKCTGLKFTDCIAHDCGVGATSGYVGGFVITYTDADFDNCVSYNIGTDTTGTGAYHFDGFNIHGTGTTNFINCKAWNCVDDGVSHHDACCGMIDGGEWYGCGKGGIASPTHGAKINISNVYCHNNSVGIYADNDSAVTDRGNIIMSNCVCVNNTSYDMQVGDYYKVIAINCVYSTIRGAANVTRYGISTN